MNITTLVNRLMALDRRNPRAARKLRKLNLAQLAEIMELGA